MDPRRCSYDHNFVFVLFRYVSSSPCLTHEHTKVQPFVDGDALYQDAAFIINLFPCEQRMND